MQIIIAPTNVSGVSDNFLLEVDAQQETAVLRAQIASRYNTAPAHVKVKTNNCT